MPGGQRGRKPCFFGSAKIGCRHSQGGVWQRPRIWQIRVEFRIEKTEPEPEGEAVAVSMRNRMVATGLERNVHLKYIVAGGRIRAVCHLG
jgi:hypothetical protein